MNSVSLFEELGGGSHHFVAIEIDGELTLAKSRGGGTGKRSFVVDENHDLHEIEAFGKTRRMSTIDFRQTLTQVKVNGNWTVVPKYHILVTLAPLDADFIENKTLILSGHIKFTKYDEQGNRRASVKKNSQQQYRK